MAETINNPAEKLTVDSTSGSTNRSAGSRECTEHTLRLYDGTELFYRAWAPLDGVSDRAVFLFHRGHEHSGRFADVVDQLGIDDCHVFAWDCRGHGRSPGKRGVAENVAQLARDADDFVRQLSAQHGVPVENTVVVAHSIGAVVVTAWVHDYAPPIRAMVLVTPALRVKLYVPLAIPGLRLLHKVRPAAMVKSYVRPGMLTHDPVAAKSYANDELIAPGVSVQLLLDLHDTSTRLLDDAGAIQTPTLMLVAGSDWVVRTKTQQQFFDRLSSTDKTIRHYEGMYHDILHEQDRERPLTEIRNFLREKLESPITAPDLVRSDQQGPSFDKWQQMKQPLPFYHPKRINFSATRAVIGSIGKLGNGMRLGWNDGFNSGRMLDYVYENRSRGITPIGKLADRIYLNSPGWTGIRVRRKHLDELLDTAITRAIERHSGNDPVHILDVAAGGGRYVLDALERHRGKKITAMLCDQDQTALDSGRQSAVSRSLAGAEFVCADAFDESALAATSPRPDIAIVSGLFELFPANEPLLRTLRGIASALKPGGQLLYTNQPWHPQQEMIARSLHGYDGKLWAMRCRSTAEMDQLISLTGFRKQQMRIDDQGIFTVSSAEI